MQCIFEGIAICQNPVGSIDGIREMVCEHKWSNPPPLFGRARYCIKIGSLGSV